ncbi:hypothetical protein [Phytopseudomonas seleniipraecipitans]|uniref:Uncharacterized protein n=1 Tax=Phytopseudomonas seleniipraecipitans TaxID=640205 RepID=A0A1G7RQA9_9GAMM|nr:hypothetical protein [Pseudomonas seleniipraecipitans]SDG12389.1 hypothetical protein SAMN05216381_3209 [Pseudomonas seleniipraecipitans]
MIYSRLIYTEHEQRPNEKNEGDFTIFSTQQSLDINLNRLPDICIQTFAVLWDLHDVTHLVYLIERAIILGVLSPVKIVRDYQGALTVVCDQETTDAKLEAVATAWNLIAKETGWPYREVQLISEAADCMLPGGDLLLKDIAHQISEHHELGIKEFSSDLLIVADDWTRDIHNTLSIKKDRIPPTTFLDLTFDRDPPCGPEACNTECAHAADELSPDRQARSGGVTLGRPYLNT